MPEKLRVFFTCFIMRLESHAHESASRKPGRGSSFAVIADFVRSFNELLKELSIVK